MNDFLSLFMFIGSIVLFFYLFKFFINKGWVKQFFHPYTNKKDVNVVYEYIQLVLLFIAMMYFLFAFNLFILLFISFVFFLYTYFFIKKNESNRWGEIYYTWDYSEVDMKNWEKSKEEIHQLNKKVMIKSPFTNRIVFTDKFIFYSKSKFLSVHMQRFDQLELSDVSIKGNLLIFHYSFNKAIDLKYHVFFIPVHKKAEAKKVVEFYQAKIKRP